MLWMRASYSIVLVGYETRICEPPRKNGLTQLRARGVIIDHVQRLGGDLPAR